MITKKSNSFNTGPQASHVSQIGYKQHLTSLFDIYNRRTGSDGTYRQTKTQKKRFARQRRCLKAAYQKKQTSTF